MDWLKYLLAKLRKCRPDMDTLDGYYRGEQPLSFIDPRLLIELGDKLTPLVFGWPALVVDSVEERLDVQGFRFGADADADQDLWDIWQANNLDEGSQMAHLEALITGRAFAIVGTNPDEPDIPRISVESPTQVVAEWDPQTRQVRAAAKSWQEIDKSWHATLYESHQTSWWAREKGEWVPECDPDEHELGRVPVVPLANRTRLLVPDGRSEITRTIARISDAVNKAGTDMMTSVEFHAMPRRWATGTSDDDFADEQGNPLSSYSSIAGRLWTNESTDVKFGQFTEAELTNFHTTIRLLAEQLAAMGCLPPHYAGLVADNPASADAIRSAEARLVKRCERKQRFFGGAWEDTIRIAMRLRTGRWDPRARSLETLWADASTPTRAQQADAAVKLKQAGIIPTSQAQEDLGYTAAQRERMAEKFGAERAGDPVSAMADLLRGDTSAA